MSQASPARRIAVIDIGKTNAKLALHDLRTGADTGVRTVPNRVSTDGPYPHFDTDALFDFILDSLAALVAEGGFDAISVTTHGASCAVVGANDLVLPMLDYEYEGPQKVRDAYERLRPPFVETASAAMPNGLNVGAQLFWLEETFPAEFAKARHILFVPQYWAWRLTGIAANEVTSVGCHTDLWMPMEGRFSSLVARRGWTHLFPPMRSAFDCLGPLKPELARRIGLEGRDMPVHCGIHDSNASLLPHLMRHEPPFTVLSTGTWVVSFAVGGENLPIDPEHGLIVNADAFGRTELCGRFMGGREFDILTDHAPTEPCEAEIAEVLEGRVMALPCFVPGTGPFPKGEGRWTHEPGGLSPGARTAAASLYGAMVAAELLRLTGARGPTIVEGPFARNRLFLQALAAATGRPVLRSAGATGTTAGAALLAGSAGPTGAEEATPPPPVDASLADALARYAAGWRSAAER